VNETQPVVAEDFVAGYEQLRNCALSRSHSGSDFGLTLFLRQGMIAWMMRAGSRVVPATPMQSATPSNAISPLPSDVCSQATLILAGLILNHSSEMTRCETKRRR
jgi:hypothetical protein